MPPVLDPSRCKVDGLAFLGLSLTRADPAVGHPQSSTHQTAFDFNTIQDRNYEYLASTNDDGWLVGGGEPPASYKLTAPDSAHVEIMRVGTFEPALGGLSVDAIRRAIESGAILIPEITVCPTAVAANRDAPPELEVRFDMEPPAPSRDPAAPLPLNWQLRFLQNQLFHHFRFPARFCPGAHHMTFVRKAEFKSPHYRAAYFQKCAQQVKEWRKRGPQPLVARLYEASLQRIAPPPAAGEGTAAPPAGMQDSGLYLFRDRNTPTHYFAPNFFPPYDTPEKKALILDLIGQVWDEPTLTFRPAVAPEGAGDLGGCGLVPRLAAWPSSPRAAPAAPTSPQDQKPEQKGDTAMALADEKGVSGFGDCGLQSIVEELLDPKPDSA